MDDATLEIPGTVTEEQPLLILNGSFLIAVFFILLQAFSFLSVFLTNLALNPKDKLHSSYKLSTWHSFRVVHIPGRSRGHVVHVDGDGVFEETAKAERTRFRKVVFSRAPFGRNIDSVGAPQCHSMPCWRRRERERERERERAITNERLCSRERQRFGTLSVCHQFFVRHKSYPNTAENRHRSRSCWARVQLLRKECFQSLGCKPQGLPSFSSQCLVS